MTKNDFPSTLHKEREAQGHRRCIRLMVLPDGGTPERVKRPMVQLTTVEDEDKAAIN